MADLNQSQFRQPAFRGFGDQALRNQRAAHAAQPGPAQAPAPAARTQGQQTSLFQADEIRTPQGPAAPTFNASQFRISRPALPGMSTRSMASQRVTPAPAPAQPQPQPASTQWVQPELSMLGPTPASPNSPGAAGPSPTHWPAPAPAPAAPAPAARKPVVINGAAHRAAGQRFGPAASSGPSAASSAAPSAPSAPAPSAPPASAPSPAAPSSSSTSQTPAWAGRAVRMGGLAVGLGAKAFESINRIATDPARSGNPLFKPNQGWSKS
ncbi:hypothetical protein [Streptomyces drozdowiczii]